MLKKAIVTSLIILIVGGAALAKSATDISVVSVGARSVAMGRAGVAVIDGPKNSFVNPAVISAANSWGLTSMSTQLMGMVDYRFLSGNMKVGAGTFGVSYVGAATPAGFYTTDELSLAAASPINYGSSVTSLSYGINLNDVMRTGANSSKLSVGANLKYFQNGFSGASLSDANASGSGIAVDLGVLLEAFPDLNLGVNFQNVGGKIAWKTGNEEDISTVVKFGLAKKFLDGKVILAADVDSSLHAGIEWRPVELFALRAGLDRNDICAGAGINVTGVQLDLAYRQDSTIAQNSNYYLSMSFSPFKIQPKMAEKVVKTVAQAPVQAAPVPVVSAAKAKQLISLSFDPLKAAGAEKGGIEIVEVQESREIQKVEPVKAEPVVQPKQIKQETGKSVLDYYGDNSSPSSVKSEKSILDYYKN